LPEQPVLNIDETGWQKQGQRCRLWVVVTPLVAFYHIAASRGAKVLKDILGESYNGILCSDMYPAYKAFHNGMIAFSKGTLGEAIRDWHRLPVGEFEQRGHFG
jgi:hypothetical protein